MPTARNDSFKNMEFRLDLGQSPRFPVAVLEDVEKDEFQVCSRARNLNEEQRSIILQTKHFPTRLQIHCYVEFLPNVDWKIMAITALKMRNPCSGEGGGR